MFGGYAPPGLVLFKMLSVCVSYGEEGTHYTDAVPLHLRLLFDFHSSGLGRNLTVAAFYVSFLHIMFIYDAHFVVDILFSVYYYMRKCCSHQLAW